MGKHLQTLWRRRSAEDGVALVEYALLLSLIAAACFAAIRAVGSPVSGLFTRAITAIQSITIP
jgi:Flp pilus assembly pilin Flp